MRYQFEATFGPSEAHSVRLKPNYREMRQFIA
jgi:hypothetical protein